MGLRERVASAAQNVITKVMRNANRTLDIPQIRMKYGATHERVTEVRVGNAYRTWVCLTPHGLEPVGRPRYTNTWGDRTWNGDGLLEFRDYPTLVDLIRGRILRRDPKTQKEYWDEFDPEKAFFYGYVKAFGDKSSNEALRFLLEVWPLLREQLRRDLGIGLPPEKPRK